MDLPKYVKELKELLDLMKSHDLAEVELEEEGQKIRLRKTEPQITSAPLAIQGGGQFIQPLDANNPAAAAGDEGADEEADDDFHKVDSPLVGTFYRSPSPEADPFVSEGDRVDEDTVICIVEAMKVMNEITAGVSGIVQEILVENGSAVEFDEPLFKIEIS